MHLHRITAIMIGALLMAAMLAGCSPSAPASAPGPAAVQPTPAASSTTAPTQTQQSTATPDIGAAVATAVGATLTALPTATALPSTATPSPTATETPIPPTPTLTTTQLAEQRVSDWDQYLGRLDDEIATNKTALDSMIEARATRSRLGAPTDQYTDDIRAGYKRQYELTFARGDAAQSRQRAAEYLDQVRSGQPPTVEEPPPPPVS